MAKDVLNGSKLSEEHEAVLQRVLSGVIEVNNKRFIHRMFDKYGFDDDMATVVLTVGTISWLSAMLIANYQIQPLVFNQEMAIITIVTYLQGLVTTYLITRLFCDKQKVKRIADLFRRFW